MPVDGGSNRLDDTLSDAFVARELTDLALIVLGETEGGKKIFLLVYVVRLKDRGEDGEAILRVERCVKVVAVDARDFLRRV